MGDMNYNILQNRIAILAVSQHVKNPNNIEPWPQYRNTIESCYSTAESKQRSSDDFREIYGWLPAGV